MKKCHKKMFCFCLLTALILSVAGCNSNEKVTTSEKQLENSSVQESNVVESSIDEKVKKLAEIIEECKQKRDEGDYEYVLDKYLSGGKADSLSKYKDTEGYKELVSIIAECMDCKLNKALVSGVLDGYISTPNSAGGVSIALSVNNYDEKIIKYVTFEIIPYNAVDDPVESEIGNESEKILKITGPVEKSAVTEFDNIWYNKTIKYAIITDIAIEYMDGTTESSKTEIRLEQNDENYDFLLKYGY